MKTTLALLAFACCCLEGQQPPSQSVTYAYCDPATKICIQIPASSVPSGSPGGSGPSAVQSVNGQIGSVIIPAASSFVTRVIADTNATIGLSDQVIIFSALTASRTVSLPSASTACAANICQAFTIVDGSGAAQSFNIVLAVPSGNIDGQTTKSITASNGSIKVISDGTNYHSIP